MFQNRSSKENYNPRPRSIADTTVKSIQTKVSKMTVSDTSVELLPFLQKLHIEPSLAYTYSQRMRENGFEDVPSLEYATEKDLESIGIKLGHARRITRSATSCKECDSRSYFSPNSATSSPQQLPGATLDLCSVQGNSLTNKLNGKPYSTTVVQPVKRLTPEERLEAHLSRKLAETRHKEQDGKWEKPRKLEKTHLCEKVRHNDDLVHRLSATSTERKVIDNVQKNLIKYNQACSGSRNSLSFDNSRQGNRKTLRENPGMHNEKSTEVSGSKRQESEKSLSSQTRKAAKEKKKKKTRATRNMTADEKHVALMNRLAMSMKQRRKNGDIPTEVKRALRGHHIEKPQWSMSDAFADSADIEFQDEADPAPVNQRHKLGSREIDMVPTSQRHNEGPQHRSTALTPGTIRCLTCSSTTGCEEDVDEPGTFYCQDCWEEFEGSQLSDSSPPDAKSLNRLQAYSLNEKLTGKIFNRTDNSPKQDKCPRCMKYFTNDREGLSKSPMRCCPRCVYEDEKSGFEVVRISPKIPPSKLSSSRENILWIVHDNPKLGSKVTHAGNAVKCWIETKDPHSKTCFRVLTGSIDYSGPSAGETFDGSDPNLRIQGDQCFRVSNLAAYIVDHEKVETKLSKGGTIVEFRLSDDCRAQLTSLKEFFHGCLGSVDMILDPQVSPGNWYPQREANSVSYTKIAPQFRSKGVGYLRLGDDMGKNGLAFLSDDGCKTFFIGPAKNSPKPKKIDNSLSRLSYSKKANETSQVINRSTHATRVIGSESEGENSDSDDGDDEGSEDSEEDETSLYSLDDIIRRLQDSEITMKWNEKAKLVNRLGIIFVREHSMGGNVNYNDVLVVIQTLMASKNINANIVKNAVLLMGQVGESLGKELLSSAFFKTIFMEALKLLKNKQVNGTVKETLARLHGQCFTLSSMTSTIGQALGNGRTSSIRKPKKAMSSKNGSKVDSSLNTVDVIEWLNTAIQAERTMNNPTPALDESSLVIISGFFLGEVSHRDQRCRQNVFEGLANVIAYGIQRLGMKVDSALKLCYTLNQINPKAWKTVVGIMEYIIQKRY